MPILRIEPVSFVIFFFFSSSSRFVVADHRIVFFNQHLPTTLDSTKMLSMFFDFGKKAVPPPPPKILQILISADDFAKQGSNINMAMTVLAVFIGLWVYEKIAYYLYAFLGGEVFGPHKHRVVLGRHTMDLTSMLIFCYMGFESLEQLGGWKTAMHDVIMANGQTAAIGAARAFTYSSAAQRLCVWQIAYEAKNFCDSVIHNDGAIFLVHHVCTGMLAFFCLKPFLHIYCAYFLGASEVSTAFLCALACFDAKRGVPPLSKAFPLSMKALGIIFAVSFVIFRVIFWPYCCYFFWIDMLDLIKSDKLHSLPIAYIFMFVNAGLTFLQFIWLREIFTTAIRVLSGDGNLSIERGDKKKK